MDILSELYNGDFRPGFKPSAEYIKLRDEHIAYMNEVQEAFGFKFMEEMALRETLMAAEEEECAFRHGFRLGALLMLELLYNARQSV